MERNILFRETANGHSVVDKDSGKNYSRLYNGGPENSHESYEAQAPLDVTTTNKFPALLPAIIGEEETNGYTCYVNIDLQMTKNDRATVFKCIETKTVRGKEICAKRDWTTAVSWVKENELAKMTAIYASPNFNTGSATDIIVYLHGHKLAHPAATASIKQYLEYNKPAYFNFREAIAGSGKNLLFVAPTLGPRSQYGNLVQHFDAFMEKVLASAREYVVARRGFKGSFTMGRLIIAAHSGGGKAMLAIANSNQQFAKRVNEFWGFDSLYQGGGEQKGSWLYFAGQHLTAKKIYAYYHDTAATGIAIRRNARKLRLENVYVSESSVKDHFKLLLHYFRERLADKPFKKTMTEKEFEFSNEISFYENEAKPITTVFNLTKFTPLKTAIVVGKHYERERVGGEMKSVLKEVVKEAPSYFLPIIIKRAIGDSGKDWFNQFTQINFLGRKFKAGQYIHIELARVLQQVERTLADLYGGKTKDPTIAGNFLLNTNEGLSGSRGQSATATFSMHMFGLAIDVNYSRNPFIEQRDIKLVNAVLERAGQLIDGSKPRNYYHGMDYDGISKLDKLLEKYFACIDKPASLKEKLNLILPGSPWYKINTQQALNKINTDLENIAEKLARGSNKEIIQKGGILDLPKEFVQGMIDGGLSWGGFYGDMMHFDMRNTGSGKKIQVERLRYQQEKKAEAELKYVTIKST